MLLVSKYQQSNNNWFKIKQVQEHQTQNQWNESKEKSQRSNLVNFVPPSELSFHLVPKHIIQKGRVKKDPSPGSDQRSLGVINPHYLPPLSPVAPIQIRLIQLLDLHLPPPPNKTLITKIQTLHRPNKSLNPNLKIFHTRGSSRRIEWTAKLGTDREELWGWKKRKLGIFER